MASNPLLDRDHASSTCRTLMSGGVWTVPEAERPAVVDAPVVNRAGFAVDAEGRRVNTLDRLLGLDVPAPRVPDPVIPERALRPTWNNGNLPLNKFTARAETGRRRTLAIARAGVVQLAGPEVRADGDIRSFPDGSHRVSGDGGLSARGG